MSETTLYQLGVGDRVMVTFGACLHTLKAVTVEDVIDAVGMFQDLMCPKCGRVIARGRFLGAHLSRMASPKSFIPMQWLRRSPLLDGRPIMEPYEYGVTYSVPEVKL